MADPVEIPEPASTDPASEHLDAPDELVDLVVSDLMCRACGYNLRGLARSGRCPECSSPIGHSIGGRWLRYSDERWVRTIAQGYRLLSLAVLLGLAAIITTAVWSTVVAQAWIVLSMAAAVGIAGLIGVWLITLREPAETETERLFSDRRLLRTFTIAGVGMTALSGFLTDALGGGLYFRFAALLMIVAGIIFAFRHAIALADRIPDGGLVSETRAVMWGMILSYGGFLAIIAVAITLRDSPAALIACGLFCSVFVACVMFSVWCLTLFSRYAQALSMAANEAKHLTHRASS